MQFMAACSVGLLRWLDGLCGVLIVCQGRLNELMSQIRMQSQLGVSVRSDAAAYQMEPSVQIEIKQVCLSIVISDTDSLRPS